MQETGAYSPPPQKQVFVSDFFFSAMERGSVCFISTLRGSKCCHGSCFPALQSEQALAGSGEVMGMKPSQRLTLLPHAARGWDWKLSDSVV